MNAPVFVGGTGRSGSTVTARVLGAHSLLVTVPDEVRIHVGPNGLSGLLDGQTTLAQVAQRARSRWYRRENAFGTPVGLHKLLDRDAYDQALEQFLGEFLLAPEAACTAFLNQLVAGLVVPPAEQFVEHSPPNIAAAEHLSRMYPEARFVHCVRDGRDAACSILERHWGPDELDEALRFWAERMRTATAALRRIDPDRSITVSLAALVADGKEAVRRLVSFLALPDEPGPYAELATEVDPALANVGRWRRDVPEAAQPAFNQLYSDLLETLHEVGAPVHLLTDT